MVDPIAVQLYTLRNLLERDFVGTLQRVAAVGYRAVELYSYGGLSPQDLRKRLDDLGLRAVSAHVLLARLEQDLGNVLEEAHTIGLDYIVCPWLPPERRRTPDDYDRLADLLDRVGKRPHKRACSWRITTTISNSPVSARRWRSIGC
ncbi:hypothetical protein GCM10025857_33300 [Alicyclobacillus contaminans]|nr:hypothetical protein GCM10025857_33300 [Alicyclobacillus contaminans]